MKYQFIFTVDGDDLQKRLEKAVEDNPKLHLEFIGCFSQGLIKALKIQEEDRIAIEGFKAVKVEGSPQEKSPGVKPMETPKRSFINTIKGWFE